MWCFRVHTPDVAVVEYLGEFDSIAQPGLHCVSLLKRVAGTISLRTCHVDFSTECVTQDRVFVQLRISVMYRVKEEKVRDAFYALTDPKGQMESFLTNAIRATIPLYTLDMLFSQKTEIAHVVQKELEERLDRFGYHLVALLITDVIPDEKVKKAMNQINCNARLRMAAQEAAEANKIYCVKVAEAKSEAQRIQGEGLAQQRENIIRGQSEIMATAMHGTDGQHGICSSGVEAMDMLMVTQYMQTLRDMGRRGDLSVTFTPALLGAGCSHLGTTEPIFNK